MAISAGNFLYPVAVQGAAVAPTAAQMQGINEVIAQVVATADADVGPFTITHNMGLSAAELAAGLPEVVLQPILAPGALKAWSITTKATNTIQITGNNVVGSGVAGNSLQVTIRRNHTIIR